MKAKEQKAKERADLQRALETKSPILAELRRDSLDKPQEEHELLMSIYPDIEKRKARIRLISTLFSKALNVLCTDLSKKYNEILKKSDVAEAALQVAQDFLNSTEEEQRIAALETRINGNTTGLEWILQTIEYNIRAYVNDYDLDPIWTIKETLMNNNDIIFGKDFSHEFADKGWTMDKAAAILKHRAAYLRSQLGPIDQDPKLLAALFNAAASEIEFTENIRLSFDKQRVIENSSDIEEESDTTADRRAGLDLVKYRMMDPSRTLSLRMKKVLSQLYRLKRGLNGKYSFVYDDLGQRVRMDMGVVYYKLLDVFCKVNSPEEFLEVLDQAVEKYSWMYGLAQRIKRDTDFRNEFYRAFRKVFVRYAIISPNGNITYKNMGTSVQTFLDDLTRVYEGRFVLGEHSIYTATGEYNQKNIERLRRFLASRDKGTNITDPQQKKKHPLNFISTCLSPSSKHYYTVGNAIEAIKMLRGEHPDFPNLSLEKILNDIGIDTTNIDIDGIVPYLGDESKIQTLNDFERICPKRKMDKIRTILNSIRIIVHPEYGVHKGVHMVQHLKNCYVSIQGALTYISEGYSMSSFQHDGKTRYSYTVPDYISKLTGIISQVDTAEKIERANKWLERKYGQFEFFRDPVHGWMSPFLADINESYSGGLTSFAKEQRRMFSAINILSVGGSKKKNTILKVKDQEFLEGIICAYFNKVRSKVTGYNKETYSWFRSPLFSDVDAMNLFRMRSFGGRDFKNQINKRLVLVLWQELNRIRASVKSTGVTVENYNDKRNNASKFNFFTGLRGRESKILNDLQQIAINNPEDYTEEADKYLLDVVSKYMQNKAMNFISSYAGDKSQLYDKITKSYKNSAKEENDDADNTEGEAYIVGSEDYPLEGSEDAAKRQKEEAERKEQDVNKWLEEFYYNDFYAQSQIVQLLFGDLAYAKDIRDFVKRNKQAYACGEQLWSLDENGQQLMERAIYLEDEEECSNSYEKIKQLLESSPTQEMDKAVIRGALGQLAHITGTDGQSFRHVSSMKKILKSMGGKWTPKMDAAYARLLSGEIRGEDFLTLWEAIKPFLFSSETRVINGRKEKVVVQHKNSEYVISALYSMLNTALNKSPRLRALQRFMEAHNIDVVHFHSVVKLGYNSPLSMTHDEKAFNEDVMEGNLTIGGRSINDITSYGKYQQKAVDMLEKGEISQQEYDSALAKYALNSEERAFQQLEDQLKSYDGKYEEGVNTAIKEFELEDYMIVQPTDDHLVDHVALFGSQLRNIIPADLPDDFTLEVNIRGKKVTLNRDQAVEYYNRLIVEQLIDSFQQVSNKFADIKSVKALIDSVVRNNPKYGKDVRDALELTSDGNAFKIPFNSPNLNNKIEEILLSAFKNAIQKQHIKGGSAVLVSNFGLSDKLHIEWNDADDPSKGIKYIPALMPAYMRDMYSDYLVLQGDGSYIFDFEKLKKNNAEDILKVIGYRIPTEDKYSIMPIKIIGFMPARFGTTIMLPSDIVAISGTDFDIDKLFLMFKNTRRVRWDSKKIRERWERWKETCEEAIAKNTKLSSEEKAEHLKDFKETDSIIHSKKEYSRDDLQGLIDNHKPFRKLLERLGRKEIEENYIFKHPKYIVRNPSPVTASGSDELDIEATLAKINDIDSLTTKKELRDNMLIDFIWGVLTSPAGSRGVMSSASYETIRLSSRQNRILKNAQARQAFKEEYADEIKKKGLWQTLRSLSKKELEDFYDRYASADDPLDINFYIDTHRNLMDGNDLIGIAAVSSSSHYKFQFANLKIQKDRKVKFIINGNEYNLDKIDLVRSPIDGELIGRKNSEFKAASPDNGKDPNLGDMGANSNTFSVFSLLARLGVPIPEIGMITTCDETLALGAAYKNEKEYRNITHDTFSGSIDELVALETKIRDGEENLDTTDIATAVAVYRWKQNIQTLADDLNDASCFSRSDSQNGALAVNIPDSVMQIIRIEDFMQKVHDGTLTIEGFEDILDENLDANNMSREEFVKACMKKKVPRLQAFYSLGIKSAYALVQSYLPTMRPNVLNLVRRFRGEIDDKRSGTLRWDNTILRKFFNALTTYILSDSALFGSEKEGATIVEKRNFYIHDFPIKLKEFLSRKNDKGEYIHEDVRRRDFIRMLTNISKKGIKAPHIGGKMRKEARVYLMEDIDWMRNHEDPEVRALAKDLFAYSYYDNGLNFGHSTFGIYFSSNFMLNTPGFVEDLREGTEKILGNPDALDNFMYQFMLNNPKCIKPYRGKIDFKKGIIDVPKEDISRYTWIDSNDRVHNMQYVSAVKRLETGENKVIGVFAYDNSSGRIQYRRINYNHNGEGYDGIPFYDAKTAADAIDWNKLKDRGAVLGIQI